MEVPEELREAKDLLQNILKAKKTLRMYPTNNPVYVKTLEDIHEQFNSFLHNQNTFTLKIKQNSILYDSEQIYYNPEKDDNLSLFLFKDGLRELTFKKGLNRDELEEFLKILSLDFDREAIDDDIVTLLWERDFQNIEYIVDEAFLVDEDEEEYGTRVEREVKETVTDVDNLMRAYADGFKEEDVKSVSIVPLTDKDLQALVIEIEKDSSDKVEKLISILFEIFYTYSEESNREDIVKFLKEAIKYSMNHGNIYAVLDVMKGAKEILGDSSFTEDTKTSSKTILSYVGNEEIVSLLAELLDSGFEIQDSVFKEFIQFLDVNAIKPLMHFLGELKTINARKRFIEALIVIGRKDIQTLSQGLEDERWYVVRNIIYILRKIADKRAIEYLIIAVRHGDVRVRKEVINALGELGGREVIQTLRNCLDDPDEQVRISSAKAFGNIGSEVAKKIILDKISSKPFNSKDFEEKKLFHEVLAKWQDDDVFNFLVRMLKKRSFFGGKKHNENKACAAFSLGLLGNRDALPALHKYQNSNNRLLREFAYAAIKRLEYVQ